MLSERRTQAARVGPARQEAKVGTMKLVIRIVEEPDGTCRAWCPVLPGCEVRGASRQEVRDRIPLAVQGYLASFNEAVPDKPEDVRVTEEVA